MKIYKRPIRRRLVTGVFLLLFAIGSGAAQDAAGALFRLDNALTFVEEDFSPEDAYYIGRAVAAHILGVQRPYTENSALTRYLNMICGALVVNSPAPDWYNGYHVMILDTSLFNAFSTSGGHIFISRRLVEAAASEDMLAAIIAHELAHIQLSHGIENIKHSRLVEDLQSLSHAAARIAAREASISERTLLMQDSVVDMVNTLLQNGYSQTQELEADSYALSLLASAGYDPASLLELLRLLEKEPSRGAGGFTTTHPLPAQRVTTLERAIGKYRTPDTRSSRQERFIRIINRRNSDPDQ